MIGIEPVMMRTMRQLPAEYLPLLSGEAETRTPEKRKTEKK